MKWIRQSDNYDGADPHRSRVPLSAISALSLVCRANATLRHHRLWSFAMATLRDFITNRRAEIANAIAGLRSELHEIDLVERALGTGPRAVARTASQPEARASQPEVVRHGSGRQTLRSMTLDVLRERPEGADKRTIIRLIRETHGVAVPVNSLTTQLSRLKSEHVLDREGLVWRVEAGQRDGGASHG
jgi:hypothetical protein